MRRHRSIRACRASRPFLDTRVVYVAETGPKTNRQKRIAIMDSDGSNHRYLTTGRATVVTPRFSPRGDKLVYMSYQGRRPRVYVMDVATGTERLLVPGTAFTFAPRFSPDGRRIVFSMASGGNTDIYVVGANGGTPRRLTSAPGADTSPSFSPDGRRIVFESDRSGIAAALRDGRRRLGPAPDQLRRRRLSPRRCGARAATSSPSPASAAAASASAR